MNPLFAKDYFTLEQALIPWVISQGMNSQDPRQANQSIVQPVIDAYLMGHVAFIERDAEFLELLNHCRNTKLAVTNTPPRLRANNEKVQQAVEEIYRFLDRPGNCEGVVLEMLASKALVLITPHKSREPFHGLRYEMIALAIKKIIIKVVPTVTKEIVTKCPGYLESKIKNVLEGYMIASQFTNLARLTVNDGDIMKRSTLCQDLSEALQSNDPEKKHLLFASLELSSFSGGEQKARIIKNLFHFLDAPKAADLRQLFVCMVVDSLNLEAKKEGQAWGVTKGSKFQVFAL